MTKAMQRKFEKAIKEFQNEHDGYYVQTIFHHYGENYIIIENETEYKIFRVSKTDIYDTLIETITKSDTTE